MSSVGVLFVGVLHKAYADATQSGALLKHVLFRSQCRTPQHPSMSAVWTCVGVAVSVFSNWIYISMVHHPPITVIIFDTHTAPVATCFHTQLCALCCWSAASFVFGSLCVLVVVDVHNIHK